MSQVSRLLYGMTPKGGKVLVEEDQQQIAYDATDDADGETGLGHVGGRDDTCGRGNGVRWCRDRQGHGQ